MKRTQKFLALVLMLAGVAHAGDWPQWRGVHRDGVAMDEAIRDDWKKRPPELLWMVEGMGAGYASVSISEGVLYSTGNDTSSQFVVAVDAMTGELLWSTPVTDKPPAHDYPGSRCTPTVDGDRLYVTSSNGGIACLLRDDGSVIWKKDFPSEWQGQLMSHWGFSESPLVDGDAVLCTPGGPDALIVRLDKLSGEEIWRAAVPKADFDGQAPPAGYSSIVVSHGGGIKQYVQMTGRGLVGVRADDGAVLWTYGRIANGTANVPTPLVMDDYIFAATGYDAGAALIHLSAAGESAVKAEEVYFLNGTTFQNHHGGMVRYGDFLYAGNGKNNGFPTCIEWKTGDVAWGGKLRGAGSGSAAVTGVGDNLLFRYQNGVIALIAATPEKYVLKGTLTPEYQERESWSHPVVVNGRLYLREQDKLMCYDVSPMTGD